MMSLGIQSASYIAASVLFILALGGLSNQESAKRAVWYGIVGMAIAVIATIFGPGVGLSVWPSHRVVRFRSEPSYCRLPSV